MTGLREVAAVIGAHIVREGEFSSLGFLQHRWPGRLTFAESEEAVNRLGAAAGCSCVLTTEPLGSRVPRALGVAVVASPRKAFFDLHEHLRRETSFYGSAGPTTIAGSARVHPLAFVAPSGVVIEEDVVIEPHATVFEGVTIGAGATIRAGVVLGAEGFQVTIEQGQVRRLSHAGGVRIGRNVEIQSNCCIDRALFGGLTMIGDDSTLDKLVYVAHHVTIGARCRIGAGAMVTGSVTVGNDVWVGPNATIRDGIVIGDGAQVSLGSVVTQDVSARQRVTGNFAVSHEEFLATLKGTRQG
jgi:UDP-3-O-[3-hydroxymyristoyl] glucosamine N-acyltransferase